MTQRYEQILRLFREGQKLETILSGWHLSEQKLSELVIQAYRAGEKINPDWLAPLSIRKTVKEVIQDKPELTNVQISSLFKGKLSPKLVHAMRIVMGEGRGLETMVFTEETFQASLHDDLNGAEEDILVVSPNIKSNHWRKHLEAYLRLIRNERQVAFFHGRISNLIVDDIKSQGIILIEQKSNANLIVIDRRILWEGSMNFLLPPAGSEHIRRTVSGLECGEILDLHDLYL
ncbi:MAG: hypothetical protein ACI97A_001409 [Planctomycetota bacterium]|jgi:hypothetical protein